MVTYILQLASICVSCRQESAHSVEAQSCVNTIYAWVMSWHSAVYTFTFYSVSRHFNSLCFALLVCNAHILFAHTHCTHAPTHVRACMNVLNCIRRILVHKDRYIGWQMLARFPGHPCGLTHQVLTMQFCLDFLYIYLLCTHTCMQICMYVRTQTHIVCTYFSDITLCTVCVK